jgi:hypothetical protein
VNRSSAIAAGVMLGLATGLPLGVALGNLWIALCLAVSFGLLWCSVFAASGRRGRGCGK